MSNSTIAAANTIGYAIEAVIGILTIIAWWKIFTKAGRPGWKSLIPFYDGHVLYEICWKPVYFWLTVLFAGGSSVIYDQFIDGQAQPNLLITLLAIVMGIVGIVLYVKFSKRLAKSFGKGSGFAVGIMLLSTLFFLILGFGKAEYVGNADTDKHDVH